MLIPYSTDVHDGRIGLGALEIIGLCFLIHIFVSIDAHRTEQRVAEVVEQWQQEQLHTSAASEKNLSEQLQELLEGFKNPSQSAMMKSLNERIESVRRESLMYRLGLTAANFRIHTLFTSMFTHAGWLHLIGNMLMFYVVGLAMEQYWGYWRFMIIYLVCGLVADATFYATTMKFGEHLGSTPLVGASGAIAGMMGAFLVTHTRVRVRLFYMITFRARGVISIPAYIYFSFWFAGQIISALIDVHPSGGVAHTAHIGGFIMGAVLGLLIRSADAASVVNPELARMQRNKELAAEKARSYFQPSREGVRSNRRPEVEEEQVEPAGTSSETAGWEAFGHGDMGAASMHLLHAMNSYFQAPAEYRLRIFNLLGRIVKERNRLVFSQNEYYQWGKQLEKMKEYRYAIVCFDMAGFIDGNAHIQKNSMLSAAALRIKTGQQLDKVQRDMTFLAERDPDGIAGNHARELLASMQYGPSGG